jgi:hypothetical protein
VREIHISTNRGYEGTIRADHSPFIEKIVALLDDVEFNDSGEEETVKAVAVVTSNGETFSYTDLS